MTEGMTGMSCVAASVETPCLTSARYSANVCHHPLPLQVIVQPRAPVAALDRLGDHLGSLIAHAPIACWPEASCAITVLRTTNPRPAPRPPRPGRR